MRFFKFVRLLDCLLAFFVVSSALGDEALLNSGAMDDLVVTGSRIPGPISEAGRFISVISREDMEMLPATTIAELLNMVGGLDVRHRGAGGLQTDISIWGSTFEQVLILIDGMNVSDAQTGHHNMDLPINMVDIDRIEILKGPGARVYGHNAMAGVINIITKTPEKSRAALSLSGGSHAYYGAQGSVSGNTGPLSNRLSASKRASDGHLENHPTDFKINTFSYKGVLSHPAHTLRFGAGFAEKDFGAYKFYTDVYPDQRERTKTRLAYANDTISIWGMEVDSGLYFRQHDDAYEIKIGDSWITNTHETKSAGFQINSRWLSVLGETAMGGEVNGENLESTNLGDHDRSRHGVFFEHQAAILPGIVFVLGTSAIKYSDWGWQHWPGVNVNIAISKGLNLFSSMGKSFRVPTYTELYYITPANQGNPLLEPEKAWTFEAGVNHMAKGLHTRAGLLFKEAKDVIDWTRASPADPWHVGNHVEIATRGVEVETTLLPGILWDILHQTAITLSYTQIHADRTTKDLESKYALDHLTHQAKGWIVVHWTNHFRQSFVLRYEKRMNDNGYFVADSRLTGGGARFKYHMDVSNIFDKTYTSNGFAPDPGRRIIFGASYAVDMLKK